MFEIEKLDWVPLTCLRPVGAPSDAELAESLERITQSMNDDLRSGYKSVIIVDMLRAAPLPAAQRRAATAWMKANMALFERTSFGTVLAIESPLVRAVLTAMLWFQPISLAHDIVGSMDSAVRWAIQQLERRDIQVPERARRELGRVFANA